MKRVLSDLFFVVAIFLIAILVSMTVFGCGPKPSPQTTAQIATIQQQNLVDVAAEQAKAKLLAQKAADNPVAHPIAATARVVKQAQKPLEFVATIAFLVAAGGVGLSFVTGLSWLSKIIVPVAGCVAVFSFFGLIALPFFPWVGAGLVLLAFVLFSYEVIRAKSLKGGIQNVESDLGFNRPAATVASTSVPLVAISHL